MPTKTAPPPPPAVTLVYGPEDLLAERAVADLVRAARAQDPAVEVCELTPNATYGGGFVQLVSPSLFGERKVVVLHAVQDQPAEITKALLDYLAAPLDEITLVVTHPGGVKGKATVDALRKSGATVIDCVKFTKPGERVAFVRGEFRAAGRSVPEGVARALLDAVGNDLRELAAACSQLVADIEGPIDEESVARYYAGRAEMSGFMVADHAVEGDAAQALEKLRWALASGIAPVQVTSALAMGVRSIAKLGGAPRGMRPADLAKELGMPPWKIDRVRAQLRGWSGDGIAMALRVVAETDAAVKGSGADPAYALERAVLRIVAARQH